MKDVMLYKDYIGSVHYSEDDEVFYGKIEGKTLNQFINETVEHEISKRTVM